MASAQLPHFVFDPSNPVHQPLRGDDADPTQAATSLRSGTFQYVNSDFLRKASSVLSNVSASTIDPRSGRAYFLRRVDLNVHPGEANLVVLDADGNTLTTSDPDMIAGHSIKLIDVGKGAQPWVVDKGSSTVRIYNTDGKYQTKFGPDIEGSDTKTQGGIGIPNGPSVVLGKITDIAFDASVGQFYITDGDVGGPYNRVVVLGSTCKCLAVWDASSPVANSIQIKVPHAVAVDPWSRVWIVDSHNSRVQVVDHTGNVLNKWTFPGLTLYGISISTARAADKTAMVYLTGNTSDLGSDTGTIMLLTATYDPEKPSDIGSNTPMTAWNNQPGTMLHWICSGPITDQEMILLSDLTNDGKSSDGDAPAASAYQLAVPRPLFQVPPQAPTGPLWPTSFHAVTLLHPFEKDNQPFCVAEIWYTELTSMQFDIYTMTGIEVSYKYKLVGGETVYSVSTNGSPYYGPFPTTKVIPAHDWIANSTAFQGQLPILNVQTNWWYQVVQPGHMVMWHWFRSDTNVPWRTMNSIDTNPNKLPILEDFAFINWPTFTASNSTHPRHQEETPTESHELPDSASLTALKDDTSVAQVLAKLVQADEHGRLPITPEQRQANLGKLGDLVPGLSPGSGGLPLPVFPSEFFMTCTMTAVNAPNPMSTEVLYNWPTKLQRTRMFDFDQASSVDAVLTTDPSFVGLGHVPGTTYLIQRYADPDRTFKCDPPIPKIGPPSPDWAAQSQAQIVATIKNNPQLSPGATTRIFHCSFGDASQSQFWIWYSNRHASDTPVVFMQTLPPANVGTNLALADYQRMQTTPLIDMVSFSVPDSCKHKSKA
ncbi:MAG: NHL repeat-containing protein 3 [Trichoglossum hirsutum]|nr:MAG: NHL repeat-containing protein 3 [Trichoglossum hirsutum]